MDIQKLTLSLLTFPQEWTGNAIEARVLLIPSGDPFVGHSGLPPFAGTTWEVRSHAVPGPDNLFLADPSTAPGTVTTHHVLTPPANAVPLLQALPGTATVVGNPPKAAREAKVQSLRVKKALPDSYISAFPFERPRTLDAVLDDEFQCALRGTVGGSKTDPPPRNEITWGRLIALALRQPLLARELGLIYDLTIPIADAAPFVHGGSLYVELQGIIPLPDAVERFAARLPALTGPRALFAATLLPIGSASPVSFDQPLKEAAIYDDGFAKIVHCFQPATVDPATDGPTEMKAATDVGIDVGWDDEQIIIWQNRQIDGSRARLGLATTSSDFAAPLGVSGYRIDVRNAEDPNDPWHSLCSVSAQLTFDPNPALFTKPFQGELSVEAGPVRNTSTTETVAWLPRYFARWQGGSLVVGDKTLFLLSRSKLANAAALAAQASQYVPQDPGIALRYGNEYAFRSRLADLTGGGPDASRDPVYPSPAPFGVKRFLRHVPPKSLRLGIDPPPAEGDQTPLAMRTVDTITVNRPLLGYPEFLFTGVSRAAALDGPNGLLAQVENAFLAQDAVGVNDPDVTHVRIEVQVRAPANDPGPEGKRDGVYRKVYEIVREFPAPVDLNDPLAALPPLTIELVHQFQADIDVFAAAMAATPPQPDQPLPIPSSRDVRIRLTPLCADKPNYFGGPDVQQGLVSSVETRSDEPAEGTPILAPNAPEMELNAVYLRSAPDMATRLADQLKLDVSGLTLTGKPGQRTVFGASAALRHTLSGDSASITFASKAELTNHWVVALMFEVERDWTWDGFEDRSFEFHRTDDGGDRIVGQLNVPFAVGDRALVGIENAPENPRSRTRLVFFDAVNPNPPEGQFPQEPEPSWRVIARRRGAAEIEVRNFFMRLPVTVNPRQVPKLLSAGVALSPYKRDEPGYSSTEPRRKGLWLEFAEPIEDKRDRYFARVTAYGPDPLLSGQITQALLPLPLQLVGGEPQVAARLLGLPLPEEITELPIEPEPIRTIFPDQAADNAGLDDMEELKPALDSDRHFLLPPPKGINPDAPELFGFWTYEIRVGHKDMWSTAQGRWGRRLRVSGVQHPAPALTCTVYRVPVSPVQIAKIVVTAPYATPVFEDRKLTNRARNDPRTRIWVLLYAQVVQADGTTSRNVVLSRSLAYPRFDVEDNQGVRTSTRDVIGIAEFPDVLVRQALSRLALPEDSPLSVLAVELFPGDGLTASSFHGLAVTGAAGGVVFTDKPEPPAADPLSRLQPYMAFEPVQETSDPLGADLGTESSRRILRVSPLTAVPPAC